MIKMLKATKQLDKRETYKMTLAQNIRKMSDMVGEVIDVAAIAIFEDIRDDKEPVTICSVMDVDGNVFATNSRTFRENLEDIDAIFDEGERYAIKVEKGQSKSGRDFIYCTLE